MSTHSCCSNNVHDLIPLKITSPNDGIINLSGLTTNNNPVTPTTDDIIIVNGSTKNLDTDIVPEEISIHHNKFKINKYIDSYCMDMFAPWEPKLLMDICILSQKCKDYNIIKHIDEEILTNTAVGSAKYGQIKAK